MKTRFRQAILAVLIIIAFTLPAFGAGAGGAMTKSDREKPLSPGLKKVQAMKFPPLKFKIPQVGVDVERVVLDNGMILYLKEDHTSPQIDVVGVIRTGSAYEKADKYGVAAITGSVMRNGGTDKLTPEQLNEKLDFMAATLETAIGTEAGNVHLNVISSQLDPGFELMAQVLRHPAFDEKEIELAKSRVKMSLIQRNDRTSNIGRLEFYSRVFPDYAYGWEYDWKVIKGITRQDLVNWHNRFYHPNNMMFAVVGDFKRDEMIALFNKYFADWPKCKVNLERHQKVEYRFDPGVFFVQKKVDQSYIRMGHLGVKRNNPDRYAIEVMDYVLGNGGFGSLLMEKVRSDEGLAYSVGSYFNTDSREYGSLGAISSTRSNATIKAARLILQIIEEIRTKKVSAKRLDAARDALINGFLFEFQDPVSRTTKLMMLEYKGLPKDYYQGCCKGYASVTADDVLRVAKKYIHPEKLTLIIVGDQESLDEPLKNLNYQVKKVKLKQFSE